MIDKEKEIEALLLKDPIRVMVVDDSVVIRGFVTKMIAEDPKISLVSSVQSAKFALEVLDIKDVEVVLLDIEMEGMSGIEALPLILKKKPGVQVIMASSLTTSNAQISMQALEFGAVDYIPKPSSTGMSGNIDFKRDLLEKIKSWGLAHRRGFGKEKNKKTAFEPVKTSLISKDKEIVLYKPKNVIFNPEVIAIGSSTGGPQALTTLLEGLRDAKIEQPIFITQHIPPNFTKTLAEHLEKASGKKCYEGANGIVVEKNCIYLAPGGAHMLIEKKDDKNIIKIADTAPENFCKPSVEPMVRSLLKIYNGKILEVILTGMGNDGHKSAKDVIEAGGRLIAQDEQTSVVWGMPGSVAVAGLCTHILPLDEIADCIKKLATGR